MTQGSGHYLSVAKLRGLPDGAPPNEESYHKPETTSTTLPASNP